ncbi:MAG TPA: NAD(P)/FAD-dependent oxidoreductase [Gaiellaceae bacterium]|jgi:pyruvate/2-oxoglutarate dehydrogenase complex dihydrolipoamide dehydrogenase (E3) component|nr:NAD(P)/FAD-dependent oxidoreductase [Gaiellaceae bacterium]
MPKQVVVLGGGVSGEAFIAALRRLDKEVRITLVENELVGGECSYWACIPSKTLLRPVEIAYRARSAHGVEATLDPEQVFWWRDQVAEKDDTSQVKWVTDHDAEVVRGKGVIAEPGKLDVDGRELVYDELMISTGSVPSMPPIDGLDEAEPWTSREGTSESEVPESLVVVGGGAVGCELAQFYSRLGARVTIVQSGEYLLPRIDRDAGDLLGKLFKEEGIELCLNARATKVDGGRGAGYRLHIEGREALESSHLMIATGRRPNVEGFGLERLGVKVERQGIVVNERLRAGEHVWAAGDVTGKGLFTHVGKYQGRVAAANLAGRDLVANYSAVPAAVFTDPQVANVGEPEGENLVSGTWRVDRVSRTSTFQDPKRPGFLKLFADPERKVVVAGVAVGPEAGEWIGQITLAIRAQVPVAVLRDVIQPFPTFSETIYFAARELDL